MSDAAVLEVRELRKLFSVGRSGVWAKGTDFVHAVDGVSFDLGRGEVLALVGESGSGKSTLALTLMGLEKPTSGEVYFEGQAVTYLSGKARKEMRRHVQMIFQDPYESLNPMMTVGETVAEPLKVHNLARNKAEQLGRVRQGLEDAGLVPAESFLHRRPHQLSGGQRQRVAIACALVLEPAVLLADEPVSMLDVSIRAEILNLLADLRRRRGISVLFITHDLSTAAFFADRIAVMYLGRIVELGPTRQVLSDPRHPYTQALLSVVPVPNPRLRHERIILRGETPNPINLPPGCRFHPRCPQVFERCLLVEPILTQAADGHEVACLLVEQKQPAAGPSQ